MEIGTQGVSYFQGLASAKIGGSAEVRAGKENGRGQNVGFAEGLFHREIERPCGFKPRRRFLSKGGHYG
jgi:hypothetical protein